MTANREAATALLEKLRKDADDIRRKEAEASTALHENGDKEGYERLLREKCDILASLTRYGSEMAEVLPEHLADWALDELEGFGLRAGQALKVGSTFFMSALLYPDDYQDGQDNDLERFIKALARGLA